MPDNFRDDLIDVLEAVSKAQVDTLRRLRRSAQQKAAPGERKRSRVCLRLTWYTTYSAAPAARCTSPRL